MSAPDPSHVSAWDHVYGWMAAAGLVLLSCWKALRARVTAASIVEWAMAIGPWIVSKGKPSVATESTQTPGLVTVRVELPKETMEIVEALVGLVEDVADGKEIAAAAVARFGDIQRALDGASKVRAEFRDHRAEVIACVGIGAGRLIDAVEKWMKAHEAKTAAITPKVIANS